MLYIMLLYVEVEDESSLPQDCHMTKYPAAKVEIHAKNGEIIETLHGTVCIVERRDDDDDYGQNSASA